MLKKNIFFFVLALFVAAGCKKEINSNAIASSGSLNIKALTFGSRDTLGTWFGTFDKPGGDPEQLPDTVRESVLIKNGLAAVPYDKAYINTSVGYYLPANRSLPGDSIAFEAAVKDDAGLMEMDIMGTQSIASVKYVKGPNNTGTITIEVGTSVQSVQVNAIDFTSIKTMAIVLKGRLAFCYVSNKLMLSLDYTGNARIGSIKTLSIGYNANQHYWFLPANGNTASDFVRLYNSYSKKLLMKEDFNIDGRSNTIFY